MPPCLGAAGRQSVGELCDHMDLKSFFVFQDALALSWDGLGRPCELLGRSWDTLEAIEKTFQKYEVRGFGELKPSQNL